MKPLIDQFILEYKTYRRTQRCNKKPSIEKKDRQCIGKKKKKDKDLNNGPANKIHKTINCTARTQIKSGCELMCSGKVVSSGLLVSPSCYSHSKYYHDSYSWKNHEMERRTGLLLHQTGHTRCHLWHGHLILIKEVIIVIVKCWKWWLQLKQ